MNKLKSFISRIRILWRNLDRPIYVGDRLRSNLMALTFVSIVTAVLGVVLIVLNLMTHQTTLLIMSVVTFGAGAACAYFSYVQKNREAAIIIPTAFCGMVFTVYAVTGTGDGSAMLWSVLLPIGISYFVSVKYGIVLSLYYSFLYMLVFYTPLRENVSMYYTEKFMERFPIMYISLSIFTCMAMVQYHKTALFEIEHTNKLTEEVARQTAVAEERSRRLEQMSFQTIQTLANAIDAKDSYTKGHSSRVSQYSVKIAQALNWDTERINDLKFAAMLHDIGKIGVPDSILNNPRKLTDVEYDIIKAHTTMGADILKHRIIVKMAEDVARSHHERYDGKGYPRKLKGEQISEEARIVAIADAFDAMSSSRVYRKACDPKHIKRELTEGRGGQFDPHFTDIFIELWDDGALDSIIGSDLNADDMNIETSSALLQEVMETFVTQSSADEKDITTGIMSRSSGETAIAQRIKEEKGCFIFFDVDNLKKINDTHGHDAGDHLLKLMGDTLIENSSDSICCRLGGDEFLLFIPQVSREEAEDRVKKIIDDFTKKKDEDVRLSAASLSAGIVMSTPGDAYNKVFNKADKTLYHTKQNGKNGYCFYDEAEQAEDENVDIGALVNGIRNSGNYEGAMGVEYREFTRLYEFIANLQKRFDYPFKLIMISLDDASGNNPDVDELERAMFYMEQSVKQAIRDVDIMTRYSRQVILVILLGTDMQGVETAVDRIFRGYYKMNGSGTFSPSYTVADLNKE